MIWCMPLLAEGTLAPDFSKSQLLGFYNYQQGVVNIEYAKINKDFADKYFNLLCQKKTHAVISPFYSFLSLRVFKENNIITYKALGFSAQENINSIIAGKMKAFNIYESLLTGPCAKDCTSCAPNDEECESSNVTYHETFMVV